MTKNSLQAVYCLMKKYLTMHISAAMYTGGLTVDKKLEILTIQ